MKALIFRLTCPMSGADPIVYILSPKEKFKDRLYYDSFLCQEYGKFLSVSYLLCRLSSPDSLSVFGVSTSAVFRIMKKCKI